MKKENFNRAAELKLQIASLEAELDLLLPDILTEMTEKEADEVKLSSGSFVRYMRRKWEYPESVKVAEDNLKRVKAGTEATGEAKYEEIPTLKFVTKKVVQ